MHKEQTYRVSVLIKFDERTKRQDVYVSHVPPRGSRAYILSAARLSVELYVRAIVLLSGVYGNAPLFFAQSASGDGEAVWAACINKLRQNFKRR